MTNPGKAFKAVVFFMLFANVYDMGGVFGIKYLSYLAGIGYLLYNYKPLRVRIEELWVVFLLFALIPTWALFKGMSSGGSIGEASSQVTPFLPGILFMFILSRGGYDLAVRYFFNILTALSITVIAMFSLLMIAPFSAISQTLLAIFQDPGHGYFGARGLAGIRIPHVYFKATLFFVAGFTYFLFKGNRPRAFLFFATLVLAFSKAGILLCLVFLLVFVLFEARPKMKWAVVVFTGLLIYGMNTWGNAKVIGGYVETISNAVQGKALTTRIRIGHWNSFKDLMADHPDYLIWGQGVGTSYFSDGRKRHVYNIELDHVDAVRQFGLLWLIAFSLIVGYIALRLIRCRDPNKRAMGMAFVSIYLAAGTNPVLITPLFMMLLAALYTKMKHDTPPLLSPKLTAALLAPNTN
ncbi:MAG: O-antigen ligase family protein [Rhodothermales bacterium]